MTRPPEQRLDELLQHINQCVLFVDAPGRIGPDVSLAATDLLGAELAGRGFVEVLTTAGALTTEQAEHMEFWLSNIFGADSLQWMLAEEEPLKVLEITPSGETRRILEVAYLPVFVDDQVARVLFVARDVTEAREADERSQRQEEQHRRNVLRYSEIANLSRDLFETFVSESHDLLDKCEGELSALDESGSEAALGRLFRTFHTLKGNARIFGIAAVEEAAHQTESRLGDLRGATSLALGGAVLELSSGIDALRALLLEYEQLARRLFVDTEVRTPLEETGPFRVLDWLGNVVGGVQENLQAGGFDHAECVGSVADLLASAGYGLLAGHWYALGEPEAEDTSLEAALEALGKQIRRVAQVYGELFQCVRRGVVLRVLARQADKVLVSLQGGRPNEARAKMESLRLTLRGFALGSFLPALDALDNVIEGEDTELVQARCQELLSLIGIGVELVEGLEQGGSLALMQMLAMSQRLLWWRVRRQTTSGPAQVAAGLLTARKELLEYQIQSLAAALDGVVTVAKEGADAEIERTLVSWDERLSTYERAASEFELGGGVLALLPDLQQAWTESNDAFVALCENFGLDSLVRTATSEDHRDWIPGLLNDAKFFFQSPSHQAVAGQTLTVSEVTLADVETAVLELRSGLDQDERASKLLDVLDESVARLRLVPLDSMLQRFRKMISDLARELDKPMNDLRLDGQTVSASRFFLERLRDVLIHALRNSIDHGIEDVASRRARGKPDKGTISLVTKRDRQEIVIGIHDDGAGIDPERVRRRAVERALVPAAEAEALSELEAIQLIFLAGFSTRDEIGHLSGRGVGMDAIRAAVEELGGLVELRSVVGQGTSLTLRFPLAAIYARQ